MLVKKGPFFFFGLLTAMSLSAQQGLQPEYNIPSMIAKAPEHSDFEGKWVRGDGTYRLELEIKDGDVQASYFNPDEINVESAEFTEQSKLSPPELVIVLRDRGYPGSTYRLSYLSERMALIGAYERPGEAPSEIYFVRDK
ncbi:MAG: hypothetical protein ACLFUF_00355 [Opitutales bacterium]